MRSASDSRSSLTPLIARQRFSDRPFTAVHAASSGLTAKMLHRLVATGEVSQTFNGVYNFGPPPTDVPDRARCAALVLPEGGTVVRRTAAWLYGIDVRSPDERDSRIPMECAVPAGAVPVRRPGLRCYQASFRPEDLTQIDGVVCTTPVRTCADLLRWLPPPMNLAAADVMAASGLIAPGAVLATLLRWPGQRFVEQARRYAAWIEPLTESVGESWLRLRVLEAGFPRPMAQIPICDARGNVIYRLDLGWPDIRIGLEYDGEEHHSDVQDRQKDERRRDVLQKNFGWQVTGVGKGEVLGRSLALEQGVGELLGLAPSIRRRLW